MMNRREMLGTAAGALAAAACGSSAQAAEKKTVPQFTNEMFYKNGQFDQEAGKKAFLELFKYHNYSMADSLKDNADFWVADFKQNDFANTGMGGIFWVNDKEHGYFGHEIFLLPGQMLVEHSHVPAEGKPAKHECWQVRHGSIHTFGEGPATVPCPVKLPESQKKHIVSKNASKLEVGQMGFLNRLEAPHFMVGGPDGAIVTEYASFHSGDGLRFTNPTVGF
jgi:D-lyxose ketol-isomerase